MVSTRLSITARQMLLHNFEMQQMARAMHYSGGKTHFRSGAIKPIPGKAPFGIMCVIFSVLPGLFVGAAISKNIANFLEENDLFVPSDDDDSED